MLAAQGCSTSEPSRAEAQAAKRVQTHIDGIGVRIEHASCTKGVQTRFKCVLAAKNGATITVDVTDPTSGAPVYQTLSGLIDGPATARRLELIWSQQAHQTVRASCPTVIAANRHMTAMCTVRVASSTKRRRIRITILNDRTGDFTYKVL
jgi:hypothetical protein